jgi:hypothetical protein
MCTRVSQSEIEDVITWWHTKTRKRETEGGNKKNGVSSQ